MGPENTHLSPFCSRKTFPPMCFLKWVHFRVPSRAVMGATACSDVKQLFSLFPTAKLLTEFPPIQQLGCCRSMKTYARSDGKSRMVFMLSEPLSQTVATSNVQVRKKDGYPPFLDPREWWGGLYIYIRTKFML